MATTTAERDLLVLTAEEAVDLTLTYVFELNNLAEDVGHIVSQIFRDLAHTDRADIAEFIAEAEPWANAGSSEAADMAAAYISEMAGTAVTASDITLPTIPWDDPFLRTWHELSEGFSYADAKESGASSADLLGRDATSGGADARMAQPGVKVRGYRRVISAKACEFCRVVATQLYRTMESATFGHHGCQCRPVGVPYGADPGKAINEARLRELKASGAVERVSLARERSRGRERDAIKALFG